MDHRISICGLDCSECYCYEAKMCTECNTCKGIVFHTGGKECDIYHCCVTKHGYKNCLSCKDIPCDIWKKTRDPKYTDEEFERTIKERIVTLKNNN